jgi:hypothetical protein
MHKNKQILLIYNKDYIRWIIVHHRSLIYNNINQNCEVEVSLTSTGGKQGRLSTSRSLETYDQRPRYSLRGAGGKIRLTTQYVFFVTLFFQILLQTQLFIVSIFVNSKYRYY